MLPALFLSRIRFGFTVVALTAASGFAQSIYSVNINTSQLKGTSGTLVFDLTSNRPLVNRADILSFVTDATMDLPQTEGTVAGDLIMGSNPAKATRMKGYTFLTELAIPVKAFGASINFIVNVSETGPLPGRPPDEFAVYLLKTQPPPETQGHRTRGPDTKPDLAITVTGERGGRLEVLNPVSPGVNDQARPDAATTDGRPVQNSRVGFQIIPGWKPDDPSMAASAQTFEGDLSEFCNRRCDGAVICTGGAFGLRVNGDSFYTFDDIGNLITQVAIVDSGKNPLGEGAVGRARVTGVLNGSVLTVQKVEIL